MVGMLLVYPIALVVGSVGNLVFLLIAMRLARVMRPQWGRTIFAAVAACFAAGAVYVLMSLVIGGLFFLLMRTAAQPPDESTMMAIIIVQVALQFLLIPLAAGGTISFILPTPMRKGIVIGFIMLGMWIAVSASIALVTYIVSTLV